jgi:hypothetical protein
VVLVSIGNELQNATYDAFTTLKARVLSILTRVIESKKAAYDSIDEFVAAARVYPICRIVGLIPQKYKL